MQSILVSIVTPVYNSESFISKTIESVLNQTYQNFEMICVDDHSVDRSAEIIKQYSDKDQRIRYLLLPEKGGASLARNLAIKEAKGNFIAFLDADDLWYSTKLEKQVRFMIDNSYDFTYTYYDFMDEAGNISDSFKFSPASLDYKNLLRSNPIGCLTVMYNADKIKNIQIPRIDKRNDYALWLKILRGTTGYCLDEILSSYRIVSNSLSRNSSKFKLVKYHYKLFYEFEDMGMFKAMYYTAMNVFFNIFVRKYTIRNKNS